MTHDANRRLFNSRYAKGTLAVAALGIAGCSEPETTVGSTSATVVASTTSTASNNATVPPTSRPTTTTTSDESVPLEWQRIAFVGVSAYLLTRDSEIALIDTGNPGSSFTIEQSMIAMGLSWNDVGHVIVTHAHSDHSGALRAVLGFAPEAVAYMGGADIPGIDSPRPIQPVGDGDAVFGLSIIETPGHTPGHISVLDATGSLLLAGDALIGNAGGVTGPDATFSDNVTLAHDSVRKLAGFQYETILFGHGDPVASMGDQQVQLLADSL